VATNGVLIDTGPIVALLSERDQHHSACFEAAKTLRSPLLTCWPVITEAVYLLRDNPFVVAKLFGILRTSRIKLLSLDNNDVERIAALYQKYSDQHLDLADVALMHLAVRENVRTVFTVDFRHFSVFRMQNGNSLEIVPVH
jgi:predicted nucleic acid-binding protein